MSRPNAIPNHIQVIVGGLSAALYGVWAYPHTYGLPRYRKFTQLYENGFEVKLDPETQSLTDQVLDLMDLSERNEAFVSFFASSGQELVSKGSVHGPHGGVIAIPANFGYKSVHDVEQENNVVNNKSVVWETPSGQALADSMLLSDSAKKFVLAREVYALQTQHVYIEGGIASLTFLFSYLAGVSLDAMFRQKLRTRLGNRLLLYSGVGSLGLASYVSLTDAYKRRRDAKIDLKAGKLGLDIAEGGVEFYNKMLQRNVALRSIMGESGPHKYTSYGNELQTYRMPHLPLSARRDFMMELVKMMKSQEKNDTANSNEKLE